MVYYCCVFDYQEVDMVKLKKSEIQSKARRRLVDRQRKAVFVEFPIPTANRLKAAAERLDITISDIVRDATESALDALEDMPEK